MARRANKCVDAGAARRLSPAYITATRSAISATTPRLWVMNSTAMPYALLQLVQQRQHLRLDRDVERGGRLVGEQHVGAAGERHRDHHALAHAAGELVRIVVRCAARRRGSRTRSSSRSASVHAASPAPCRGACAAPRRSGRRRVRSGLSAVIGSWKIIAMRVAAHVARSRARAEPSQVAAVEAASRRSRCAPSPSAAAA